MVKALILFPRGIKHGLKKLIIFLWPFMLIYMFYLIYKIIFAKDVIPRAKSDFHIKLKEINFRKHPEK